MLAFSDYLPRHYVAMVFHLADENLIALIEECLCEAVCKEVDALGGATREENFVSRSCIDKLSDSFACAFMQVCGLL